MKNFSIFEKTHPTQLCPAVENFDSDQNDFARPQYVFARALYATAKESSLISLEALASVVMNRYSFFRKDGRGKTIEQICLNPDLFPCWKEEIPCASPTLTDEVFRMCSRIAGRAMRGLLEDKTNEALRFHHSKDFPDWAHKAGFDIQIGDFIFYYKL
ncbi:MAG: cell wall hydrolase [Alphaproteobacteria bacterium]